MKFLILLSALLIGFAGCQSSPTKNSDVAAEMKDVSPAEAQKVVSTAYSQFIDVRTQEEYAGGHAGRAINIPLDELSENIDKLEKNEPVYIICQTGNRSTQAAAILREKGFRSVFSIAGGTVAWQAANLPMETGSPHTAMADPGKVDEKTRQALESALEDERRAQAIYQGVLNKYPGARPFVNIIEAEKQHQTILLGLFEKYGLAVPVNNFDPAKMPVAGSIADACKEGIVAENENIALYDEFFQFVEEPDIREAFTRLQRASRENHLPAFTRCGSGGNGRGQGWRNR